MSTVAEIRKQIKSAKTGPLYLLEGDDLQSRHDLALEFANVVEEGLHAFNVQSFYANEASNASARDQLIGQILSNAHTLPMMDWRLETLLLATRISEEPDRIAMRPLFAVIAGNPAAIIVKRG